MQVKERSFWSTTSGLVTGLAGLLTAIVGLITVAVQLGWVGGDDGNGDKQPATDSAASSTPGSGPAGTTGTTSRGLTGGGVTGSTAPASASRTPLSANHTSLTFDTLVNREKVVTITNGGSSSIPLRTPTIEGIDSNQFSISNVSCGSRLDVNRTCDVKVTYQATRTGQATARLVIQPSDSTPALEVPLSGSRPL